MIYETLPVNSYYGNNSTTTFDFDFYIENSSQIDVYLYKNNIKTKLVYGTDYTINEFKNINGSYITYPIENSKYNILQEDEKIIIELNLSINQQTQYNNSSLLNLDSLEYSFDYLTRLIQILNRKMQLCVKVQEGSDNTPDELLNDIYSKVNEVIECNNSITNSSEKINNNIILVQNLISELNQKISQSKTEIEELSENSINNIKATGFYMENEKLYYINSAGEKTEFKVSSVWGKITGTFSDQTDLQSALGDKQETLVSGTNIKTINNTSILGSGNISINAPSIYLKTAYVNGKSGYNIWSNGYCEQWGILTTANTTVTLTKTYNSTNYNLIALANDVTSTSSSTWSYTQGGIVSANTIFLRTRLNSESYSTEPICWKTSGYLASGQY